MVRFNQPITVFSWRMGSSFKSAICAIKQILYKQSKFCSKITIIKIILNNTDIIYYESNM